MSIHVFGDADALAETIVREVGRKIVLALPLGLGEAGDRAVVRRLSGSRLRGGAAAGSPAAEWRGQRVLLPRRTVDRFHAALLRGALRR
jgi:hypothetical protein